MMSLLFLIDIIYMYVLTLYFQTMEDIFPRSLSSIYKILPDCAGEIIGFFIIQTISSDT